MSAIPGPPKHRRLGTLKGNTITGPVKPPPRGATPTPPPAAAVNKYAPCCPNPNIKDDGEGTLACLNCYSQIGEANNIVSDVTFQEDSRGAAAVQGGFISETARHASTLGAAITRATGAGERNSTQEIEKNARKSLDKLCPTLGIPEDTRKQAVSIYTLASRSHFSTGRRTDEVAAASLYAACRRQRDNQVMLIDISELLQMNVFRLGEVYKAMCKDIHLNEGAVGTQYLVEVESLVLKYCRKLEFGDATKQVASDAVKIVRRMKRDWMVAGRHPAGLCGASIILAARMNNFRRSAREVVYVAKVADITIAKRVEEFRRLKAAALTVEQFREYGVQLKGEADPPVLYESELKKNRLEALKRKRQESTMARDSAEPTENPAQQQSSDGTTTPVETSPEGEPSHKRQRTETGAPVTPPDTQQESRRDADGFLIPALPRTQATQEPEGTPEPKRGRGRPKKTPPQPIIITEEELAAEEQLELDINDNLNAVDVQDLRNELEKAKSDEQAKQISQQQKQIDADTNKTRREAEGITWVDGSERTNEEITPEDLETEFADDIEVQNCLLSDTEQKVKEQIWVLHNEDWLRQQLQKSMQEAVNKANGRDPKGRTKRTGGKVGRKRNGKMGDGTTLANATTPIETPADAAAAMLDARGGVASKYINWDILNKVMRPNSSRGTSTNGGRTPNVKGGASGDATPSTDHGDGSERQDGSLSPSPAARSDVSATRSPSPTRRGVSDVDAASVASTPAPESPAQAQAGAIDTMEDDPDDYYQSEDENPYGYDEDEREDIGEDDGFTQATGRFSNVAMHGDVMDDDDYM